MIIVVEGPSAAGKTTWCRRHAQRFVAEYQPTGGEPNGTDAEVQAEYWIGVDSGRLGEALCREAEHGVAVCDGDPLKLHYAWCPTMVGAAPRNRFARELRHARLAFPAGKLGLADITLLSIPSPDMLIAQREGDSTRRRRSFTLHARLREPLTAWYRAIDDLDPGRVVWELPPDGLSRQLPPPRPDRCDVDLLDALVQSLPAA